MKGLDTTSALTQEIIDQLKANGIQFVIKYTENSETFPNKRLTYYERALLVAAGIKSGFVYEVGNTPVNFTAESGAGWAASVISYFEELGVPAGTPCFLAIDWDASPDDWVGNILPCLQSFHDALKASGYLTGVYGSGYICGQADASGYARFVWQAQSTGWAGYDASDVCDIYQAIGSFEGIDADPDTATSMECFW